MKKKMWFVLCIAVGVALMLVGICLQKQQQDRLGGVCIGIGAGLMGSFASRLYMTRYNERHPQEARRAEIEFADERNAMIRNRAKAMTSDIIQWCIMALAYVTIIIDAPLWLMLITVGVFVLKNVLEIYLMARYEKQR